MIWALLALGCYDVHINPSAARTDAGAIQPEADAAAFRDAGDGAVIACHDEVAPFVGPGCAAATRACIRECSEGDSDCVDRCIARDAACAECVGASSVRCANEAGCQVSWDRFACCARGTPGCASASGLVLIACGEGCESELLAYDSCAEPTRSSCERAVAERCALE